MSLEEEEMKFLRLASERGKFALSVTNEHTQEQQDALESLMEKGWIRLIDVTMISSLPGLFRIFQLSREAWAKITN